MVFGSILTFPTFVFFQAEVLRLDGLVLGQS